MGYDLMWKIDGKVLVFSEVRAILESIRDSGPTGVLLVGADGAVKSRVVSEIWNNFRKVVTPHLYGGPDADMASGFLVVDNQPGLAVVELDYRSRWIKKFREAGAKNLVMIWAKYPDDTGWTTNSGLAVDKALRDNPPSVDEGVELVVEAEVLTIAPEAVSVDSAHDDLDSVPVKCLAWT